MFINFWFFLGTNWVELLKGGLEDEVGLWKVED